MRAAHVVFLKEEVMQRSGKNVFEFFQNEHIFVK